MYNKCVKATRSENESRTPDAMQTNQRKIADPRQHDLPSTTWHDKYRQMQGVI